MPFTQVRARALRFLVVPLAFAASASLPSCGSDGGATAFLPPGPPTQQPPGDTVIYAAMAIGNRIDAFRLGTDGLLPAQPFDSIHVENPRRLIVANGVLYATLFDRVISIKLGDDGSLPNTPTAITASRSDYDPIDIIVRNNILYVAASGLGIVQSFQLDLNGQVPTDPTAVGEGEFSADFQSLELAGNFLYAGARDTQEVEVFLLEQDGHVPPIAEQQEPDDRIALPDDIEIRQGILYVTSASDRSIRAYRIQPNGFLGGEEDSRTKSEEYYSDFFLEGDTLFAAAYNAGRIDLYNINPDGMLPEEAPFYSTKDDPSSYPARIYMHGGILYVTTAGHNRIDAYVLSAQGVPPQFPSSSTTPTIDSLPLDLAIYETN